MRLRVVICTAAFAATPGFWGVSTWQMQTPATPAAAPAEAAPERLVVPWTDPARPGALRVHLMTGSVTVRGYEGKDVIVDVVTREGRHDDRRPARGDDRQREADTAGLTRIPSTGGGVTVEEENNEMRVSAHSTTRHVSLTIQVPRRTSLTLKTINNGAIVVDGVEGELEVSNINGPVTLTDVAGSVVAHALNDDVVVRMTRVSGKPMSFSSLNGDIDVTFPAGIKANVRLETVQGEIFTDFDLALLPARANVSPNAQDRREGGRYEVKLERAMNGTINGGGPEVSFKNFNGDIRIRKTK